MGIVIDGVVLPDFPEVFPEGFSELDRLGTTIPADYPYRVIVEFISSNGSTKVAAFGLIASMNPIYLIPSELMGTTDDVFGTMGNGYFFTTCYFNPDTSEVYWIPVEGTATGAFTTANPSTQNNIGNLLENICWSNYDILRITSVNETTGEFETEIYFPNSETPTSSLPPYLCESSDWYKAVCNEIRRISKNYSSFEFEKDSIEKALYGGVVSPKSIIEGSFTKIIVPETVNVNDPNVFYGNKVLQFVDLGKASQIHVQTLQGYQNQGSLETLILRSDTVVTVNGIGGTSGFMYPLYGTNIASARGYIYVPSALVDSYKADGMNRWSKYADQFRAIEDYPDICGLS